MAERVNLPTQVRLPKKFLEDMVKAYGKGVVDYFEERDFIQYQLFRKTGGSQPLPIASADLMATQQANINAINERLGSGDALTSDETGFTVDSITLSTDMTEA